VGSRLGRIVVLPFATIGVIAAVLVWEIEHVGSISLAIALAALAVTIGVVVARRLHNQIDELSAHYEALLRTADEESRRAEAASRIKDEFLATLSHELRTPLNSVLGWARLLAGGKLDAVQSAKAIQAIERAGWAQSRLIEDLLDISRIVAGRLEISPRPTIVQPILERVIHSLEPAAAAKGIMVETHLEPDVGPVNVDPDRLQQLTWHLVSNAIKFTPSDGRVVVALNLCDQDVCLSVTDTGIGFTEETATFLFEHFRQGDSSTTRSYGGIGLGLGIVRHLVEMHGGTVTARSEGPQKGATFEVRFPQRISASSTPEQAPSAGHPPLLEGVSVLVVDDDRGALEFARSSLEQYGASVATATSADEARVRLRAQPPDVLLSDLRMPGEDGLQLIREVRELDAARGRHTPAAALTALVRSTDRQSALDAGYEMHVAKPIDPFELAVAVEQLMKVDG
jgi:signal transduction histidine kinase/CheY-like chemotaxis protein